MRVKGASVAWSCGGRMDPNGKDVNAGRFRLWFKLDGINNAT